MSAPSLADLAVDAVAAIRDAAPQGNMAQDEPREILNEDIVHNQIVRDFEEACKNAMYRARDMRASRSRFAEFQKKLKETTV